MKTRVTITMDPATLRLAKRTARARRTTVSGLIDSLLKGVEQEAPSIVDQLIGCATLRKPKPGTDPLYDALVAKYLRP